VKAYPAEFELVAPRSLPDVLSLLAREPGAWLPIAGGTDVMVQYSAGKLLARKLVSIWNLPELRRMEVSAAEITIGAGCTYTDLREHEVVSREFSVLSKSAGWTGGIANQNRGTIGGNIVNASPAADSLPALLVYEAELLLVSARGERRVPYANFHVDYRKTQLAADELIRAICLKRQFSGYYAHARKVGARNAQAIAKICLAGLGHLAGGIVDDIRLAVGSVAPVPLRLSETERIIKGKPIDSQLIELAKTAAAAEVRPIDDIRSTARYRAAVAANLVGGFLEHLDTHGARSENTTKGLARWNGLQPDKAAEEILPCCGSKAWAHGMSVRRPLLNEAVLLAACDEVWRGLPESDWLEAFRSHPRIGDSHPPAAAPAQSAAWSGAEQQSVGGAAEDVKAALAAGNREYEKKFNRIFIVCATGKSAPQILEILRRRLQNDEKTELHEAAEQQRQIAHLRLKKWLSS
jgi:OHCU decarboxylase